MIRVIWANLNPAADARGSWDQGIVEELTDGPEFKHQVNFRFVMGDSGAMMADEHLEDGAVVVIPGQHQVTKDAPFASALANMIAELPWALTIVTSDEEALFPVESLPRDSRHVVWNQYHDRGMDKVIPIGAAPGTAEGLARFADQPRELSVAFAGQATHERRVELVDTIKEMATDVQRFGDIGWAVTTGFREGLSQDRYLDMLARTRIAPCPSGPHSLDSFRLYEALAAGCLPIIEARTPHGFEAEFWQTMFGPECPLPILTSWGALPSFVEQMADDAAWKATWYSVQDWWRSWRTRLTGEFFATVGRLSES